MQVKVFEAQDMASGLRKVKSALGPDALILSTKTIRQGKLGMLGKATLEITAAIDNDWEGAPSSQATVPKKRTPLEQYPHEDLSYEEIWKSRESTPAPLPYRTRQENKPTDSGSNQELAELRSLVKGLSNRVSSIESPPLSNPYVEPEYRHQGKKTKFDPIIDFLAPYGINAKTARMVASFAPETLLEKNLADRNKLSAILTGAIGKLFNVNRVLQERCAMQQRISCIGPTGVGKTTTIAKIAANYLSRFGGSVALITIDTYRIAAVEQLKVYGEIMNLPVEVVIKPADLKRALEKHRQCDLILIDTAGSSPRNEMEIQELAGFFHPQMDIKHHLLLSAATRELELETTIKRFSCLPVENIIFSKIDECESLGVLLNMHHRNSTPISFLTTGQKVPEDIISPDSATIAEFIMNDKRNMQ